MRLHTSVVKPALMICRESVGVPLYFMDCTEYGSRTHARAFEVRLSGSGGLTNTGRYGAGDEQGATWDEWGAFMGAVYLLDENARWGGTEALPHYANAEHFHLITANRFRDGRIPHDTHPRHRWVHTGDRFAYPFACSLCSAERGYQQYQEGEVAA